MTLLQRCGALLMILAALMWGPLPLSFGAQQSGCGACVLETPATCAAYGTGHDGCGNFCTKPIYDYCPATTPVCNPGDIGWKTNPGITVTCSKPCSAYTMCAAPSAWVPYGTAFPDGKSAYQFGFSNNYTKTLLGLAAKGNIVVGDYTADQDNDGTTDFQERGVLSMLQPWSLSNPDGKTQPYEIDPSDADLGYDTYGNGVFDGDYTKIDEDGQSRKLRCSGDASVCGRKFYESSLPDEEFHALVDPTWRIDPNKPQPYRSRLDAVLYTNHAFTGFLPHYGADFFGSIVARDDATAFGGDYLSLWHDLRLLSGNSAIQITLPMSLRRPELTEWKECAPSGCDL